MGLCNSQLATYAGWRAVGLGVRVPTLSDASEGGSAPGGGFTSGAPRRGGGSVHYEKMELVYPARPWEADDPESTGRMWRQEAHRQGDVVALRLHPPFGSVPSHSNPVVPNGALFPRCFIAANRSEAVDLHSNTHQIAPYLVSGR